MPDIVERKLTTILCADVEGYSRLMGQDEVRTLEILRRHRTAFVNLIERHRGRLVNTWGDGLIAEFPSVVESVRCAIETQKELRAANDGATSGQRLEFRIGINLGDVMVDGTDLYGEGVNVAARLQSLAEPGGIVISGTVHDQVRGKLTVAFEFAGQQQLKNIDEPIPAFRVAIDRPARPQARRPAPAAAETEVSPARKRRSGWRQLQIYLVIAGFFFLLNMFSSPNNIWFQWPALSIGFVMALWWLSRR